MNMEEENILMYGQHNSISVNQNRYIKYGKINGIDRNGEPILIPEGINYVKDFDYGDYVPLFAIPGFDAQSVRHSNTTFYDYFSTKHTCVHNKISSCLLGREENGKLVVDKVSRLFMEHLDNPTLFKASDFIKEAVGMNHTLGGSTYNNLMIAQSNLSFSIIRLRRNSYISGYHALLTKEGDLIWTLAVRKEHVKYVKLCFMLGKSLDPRVLVFMAQTGFNSRTTFNKPLRSHFRKQMRDWLEHHSVKFVEMDFKSKLTGSVNIPEDISTLSEIEEWERNTVDEFLNSLNVTIALKKDNIELINDIE